MTKVANNYGNIEQEYEEDIADALQYINDNPTYFYRIFAENIINSFIRRYLDKVKGIKRADRFVSGLQKRLENLTVKIMEEYRKWKQ